MSNVKLDSFTYVQPFENDVVLSSIGDMYNLKSSIAKNLSTIEDFVYRFGDCIFKEEQHIKHIEEDILDTVLTKGLFMYIQGKIKLENLSFTRLVFTSSIIPIDEKKSEFKVEVVTIK